MGTMVGPDEYSSAKSEGDDEVDQDAGALFVLKSKGSWWHCGYHLTTSIVAPPLLSLPFAFALLGWAGGMVCLVGGAAVTFYSYNLMSHVLEHNAQKGRRLLRFRDMASHIMGPRWGRYYVGPIQLLVCYGAVIGNTLLGGQCLKTIYLLWNPNGSMKLYEYVTIFGVVMLILAQIPSFHSLRYINLVSLILSLCYSACATVASIYIGVSSKGPRKDYSVDGDNETRIFGIFNAVAIIATTYGNGIIPEIQATLAPPVKGKMFKGLCICYAVVLSTFFSVAISGYWAFGNQSEGLILTNFTQNGKNLVPKPFIFIINLFTIMQLSAVAVVYLQPTNEMLETMFGDPKSGEFSSRNVIPRVISRSLSVVVSTTIAAMLPFFGDINAVIGAFGFMPLDFVLPMVFFNSTFKPSKRSGVFWLNLSIAVVFSILGVIAAVAAVRQIILDAKTFRLFANV
ncbi:PREDICTED: GABA transporter 1 [Ipomoea nil]|uniref:GABA transporter 1 n=1 Tax=Ipomoea nil TaxID=35883 RepID=UPI000901F181|nr:PREDICTED: GABA transporter 1 [Ipomoea nil]